jgi:hypothetical protein
MKDSTRGHQDASSLRSVLFVPGRFSDLFSSRYPYGQLDAIGEILDFANCYVLNDAVTVSGLSFRFSDNSFGKFVETEIESSDSVETVGYGAQYKFDITPFDESLKIPDYETQLKDMDRATEEFKLTVENLVDPAPFEAEQIRSMEADYSSLADEARVLQQQSYIWLADRLQATYVPERLYGRKALESYPKALRQAAHSTEEEFRKRLSSEVESLVSLDDLEVHVPSFFVEALRESQTIDGIWHALRDLRYSQAAETYRSLVRVVVDDNKPIRERQSARRELQAQADAIFSGESLKSRIPQSVKFVIGLSSAVVGVLIPTTAILAGAAPVLVEGLETVDQWLRRRANIFWIYSQAREANLFSELRRLFPSISFEAGHLDHFLKERNFGWSEALERDLYSSWLGSNV